MGLCWNTKEAILTLSFVAFINLGDGEKTFWYKFEDAVKHNALKPTKTESFGNINAKDILDHIQDRINSQKMKKCQDELSRTTVCKEGTGTGNKKRRAGADEEEEAYDLDFSEIEHLFGDIVVEGEQYSELSDADERKTDTIRRRGNISDESFADPPRLHESSFVSQHDDGDEENDDGDDSSQDQVPLERKDFHVIIEMITGVILQDGDEISSDESDGIGNTSSFNLPLHLNESNLSLRAIAEEFGLTDDEKQMVSFEVMCSTFILDVINSIGADNVIQGFSVAMDTATLSSIDAVKAKLKQMGAEDQLLMFLTGAGGCGKSHVIHAARKFCHRFSQAIGVIFNANSFFLTAYLGSAAALWGGITIHSAAHLCKKRITDDLKEEWKDVRILIIDEVSYFSLADLKNLDRKLKTLRSCAQIYGGVSIVFAGDFHQLHPIGSGKPFYYEYTLLWHGSINSAVTLENNHRFADDPLFGELLGRIRQGLQTSEDIETINSRHVTDPAELPRSHEEYCYACPQNIERNSVSEGMFESCIKNNPTLDTFEHPPDDVVVIESNISSKHKRCSRKFHDYVFRNCGDAQVRTHRNKRVDPALKWYPGIHLMINSNDNLKEERGNGTLCRGLKLKLKDGATPRWKNYNGKKVYTININDIEYMLCEHWLEKKDREAGKKAKQFKLFPEETTVMINLPLAGQKLNVGGFKIKQFGVNSNIATTGHKLQGMSKDKIIVTSWSYKFKNWIYVILSRVRTLDGLHLLQKLKPTHNFTVDEELLREERRIAQIEQRLMARRRGPQ